MNTINRELLRIEILRLAEGALPNAVSLELLLAFLRRTFHGIDSDIIHSEVLYLIGKGLLEEVEKTLSPENKLWKITATGRDLLAKEGLE